MKTLTALSVIFLLFTARFLHWLAIFQQKEYRLDRIRAFLGSEDGKREIRQMLINKYSLNPKKWKRPALTTRIILIAGFSFLIMILLLFLVLVSGLHWQTKLVLFILTLILEYLLMPMIIGIVTVLSSFPAKFKTESELKKAKLKLKKSNPTIIGIGGSYGKTSTKYLLEALLSQKYSVFKTPKSFNTPYSIANSIKENYRGEEIVLLEYGAYQRGEIEKLTQWFKPDHAVITGFTEQHLHLFGSVEDSQKAESELVSAIGAEGNIWFNADDIRVEKILEFAGNNQSKKIPYSANHMEDWQIDNHGYLVNNSKNNLKTKIVGKHYLTNLAGAIAVAEFLELDKEQIEAGIKTFDPDERFVRSYPGKHIWILDDGGTSNPVGFAEIIKIASEIREKPKTLIVSGIVDLGDISEKIHRELAFSSGEVFDQILYVGAAGKSDFEKILPDKVISEQGLVQTALESLPHKSLLVIEGRIPGWIRPVLQTKGAKL